MILIKNQKVIQMASLMPKKIKLKISTWLNSAGPEPNHHNPGVMVMVVILKSRMTGGIWATLVLLLMNSTNSQSIQELQASMETMLNQWDIQMVLATLKLEGIIIKKDHKPWLREDGMIMDNGILTEMPVVQRKQTPSGIWVITVKAQRISITVLRETSGLEA